MVVRDLVTVKSFTLKNCTLPQLANHLSGSDQSPNHTSQ